MRKILLIAFATFTACYCGAQKDYNTIHKTLREARVDTSRFWALSDLYTYYAERNYDSALYYASRSLELADQNKWRSKKAIALGNMGYCFTTAGNTIAALEYLLEAKKIAEEEKDEEVLAGCLHMIANLYSGTGKFREAIIYYQEAAARNAQITDTTQHPYTSYMNLASMYTRIKKLDSALYYGQRAYEMALKFNKTYFPNVLRNLGRVHQELGNKDLTLYYYRAALSEAVKLDGPGRQMGAIYNSLSQYYKSDGQVDSAIYYARAAIRAVEGTPYKAPAMAAYTNLSDLYQHNGDSAYKYLKIATALKDSVIDLEKAMQFEAMRYQEDRRQQLLKEKEVAATHQRRQNMQYAAVGGGIILFLILFFLLSHSVIVNEKVVKFLGVLALLVVFEFINLFLHPYVGAFTHHSPQWMLLIMVSIAAILVPIHHKLEKWITHQMVEKNKRIRISAARKTLAELEGTGS